MSDNVHYLFDPHWVARCWCSNCGFEWTGAGPVGVTTGLECPECREMAGTAEIGREGGHERPR